MSISVIIADCVMLHCTKKKKFYQKIKEIDIGEDKEMKVKTPSKKTAENIVRI